MMDFILDIISFLSLIPACIWSGIWWPIAFVIILIVIPAIRLEFSWRGF